MRTTSTVGRPGLEDLVRRLDAAVRAGDVHAVAEQVKQELQAFGAGGGALPDRFRRCRPDTYARRLLHRHPQVAYTAVVMTWGPGQGTELHDHAGMWCVECVLDGELEVVQYEMVSRPGEPYRFEKRQTTLAAVGSAGCLIPPFEYHTLRNARAGAATITLHVYGGEMETCNVYRPAEGGSWLRVPRTLGYSD
jgi:predicted metal-dependent enzyme (double-stranded beta helix superfamily)